MKTKLQNKPTDTSFVSGSEIGDISRLTIHILLYSVLGSLVSKIIIAAKLPMVTGVPYLNDPYFLYSSGIGIGALLGIYSLEIAQKNFQKSVLFLILFQIFGKQFLGPFAELLVYFFGLGSVFDYFFKKECNIPDNKANFINGITIAWYSQFYELSGKYTGRFLGLLIIGPEGSVVGELLGEKIAGILGISLGWRKLRINASEEASISNKSDVQN